MNLQNVNEFAASGYPDFAVRAAECIDTAETIRENTMMR